MKNAPRNALISGAGKRVGQAVAIALAKNGWNVALHHNSTDIAQTVAGVEKLGVKFCTIQANLNNHADVLQVLPQANAALGEISLLVNNASIFEKCSFAETDEDVFDRHMNINFKAPFFLSQAFAKQTENGQIINICDTNVSKNKTTYFAYLLSKKSLSDLTKMLAVELGPRILVNGIFPTTISEFSDNVDQHYLQKRTKDLPLKNITNIVEILDAVNFLINSNLTGQEVFTDGGEQLL